MSALVAEPLSQVRADLVRWLWPSYLPRGKLALLDGDPGVGKSLLTVDLAARLSRGGELPGGTPAGRPHVVLLLSGEDAAADTTRPRAAAAGADLDRVRVVSAGDRPFHLPVGLPDLETLIRDTAADLVVIDPLMAFLPPRVAASVDQCVRTALTPLAALAERTDCGVLLVRHLTKQTPGNAVRRGQGSMGIIGAARTGLLAGPHPTDPTRRVLAVSKSNVAGAVPSLGYRIVSGPDGLPVAEWTGPVDLSADAIRPPAHVRARDRAALWLHAELRNGPRRATELLAAAAEAGIPERTLERAKAQFGVKAYKFTHDGRTAWYWYDPTAPWPADAPFRKPRPNELPPIEGW